MIEPTGIVLAMSLGFGQPLFVPDRRDIRVTATGGTETPLPSDMYPAALLDLGTRAHAFLPDPGALFRSAHRYMMDLAVIPIDSDIDDAVEAQARKYDIGRAKRAITRRR